MVIFAELDTEKRFHVCCTRCKSNENFSRQLFDEFIDALCNQHNDIPSLGLDAIGDMRNCDAAAKEIDTAEFRCITYGSYGIFVAQATAWAVLRFTRNRAEWVEGDQ